MQISPDPNCQFQAIDFLIDWTHKELTYLEYRAESDVFQNIDPHPPLLLASVSSPRTKGGGTHSPGNEGCGGSIF